jgi:hypothetical protein
MNLPDPETLPCVARPLEISLHEQHTVMVQAVPTGQEPPAQSDALVVEARLYLPAGGDTHLIPTLQFGKRLRLLDDELGPMWGCFGAPDGIASAFRHDDKEFVGRRWDVLLREAVRYLFGEVRRLDRALSRRQAKLRAPGWEYYADRQGITSLPAVSLDPPKRHIVRNQSRVPEPTR